MIRTPARFFLKPGLIVAVLLATHFLLAFLELRATSGTLDEGSHLSRGLAILRTGEFRLSVAHPPLINIISALPVAWEKGLVVPAVDAYVGWNNRKMDPHQRKQRFEKLLFSNNWNRDPAGLINRSRLMTILLSLLLGFCVYLWAKKLYGVKAGLLALFFYCLSPDLLAHSALVTNDLGAALFIFLAGFSFWRFLEKPGLTNFLAAVLVLGLAQLSKFSAVLLYPLFLIIFILAASRSGKGVLKGLFRPSWRSPDIFLSIYALILFLLGSLLVIWAGYGFEIHSFYNLSRIGIVSCPGAGITLKFKCLLLGIIKTLSLPPLTYYYGLCWTLLDTEKLINPIYFMGRLSTRGWWYYYPLMFLIKTPLPILLLIPIRVWLGRKGRLEDFVSKLLIILAPVFFFLAFIFLNRKQVGLRHILMIYPFIFVYLSGIASPGAWEKINRWKKFALGALLVWYALGAFWIHPDYLVYFNELVGGPEGGLKISVAGEDWGQDRKHLAQYQKGKNLYPLYYRDYGEYVSAQNYGLKFERFDCENKKPGYYAIHLIRMVRSGNWNYEALYGWFRDLKPIAKVHHTIYIYQVTGEDLKSPSASQPCEPTP